MISKLTRAAVIGLGTLAVPVGIAVAGSAPASADPGLCVSGPFGYAYACVDTPNWGWYGDGPRWHGHGHGHDGWGDD